MISSINQIKFSPHKVFEGGIQAEIRMDGHWISIISGGRSPGGFGGSYGRIVEDFTINGKDLSNSTFELAIIRGVDGNFVTHEFFQTECNGDQVAGFLSADKVVEMLNELGHHHQLLFSQE